MSNPKFPDRLYIPPEALAEWHEKAPGLPAFEGVCVGDPCEVYVREAAIMEDPRVIALVDSLQTFIDHEVDYMVRNCLGDPEQQQRVIVARSHLAAIKGQDNSLGGIVEAGRNLSIAMQNLKRNHPELYTDLATKLRVRP